MLVARTGALSLAAFVLACNAPDAPRFAAWGSLDRASTAYDTVIVRPTALGGLNVSRDDAPASSTSVPCATCHDEAGRPALARREGHPKALHADIVFQHGSLKCQSCHDAAHPGSLRLASGETFPLAGYMELCAQCHGPQYRDYTHGSHGGMKGHWDLHRGPRERNGCIACHGAHNPAYPRVLPAPPPRDRFLEAHAPPGSAIENRWSGGEH